MSYPLPACRQLTELLRLWKEWWLSNVHELCVCVVCIRYMPDYRHNGSHRNGYDLNSAGTGRQEYQSPRSEYQLTEQEALSSQRGFHDDDQSPEQLVERYHYQLAIDERVASRDCDRTPTAVSRVDLRVHLDNESTVVIDNIPFYFARL